MNQSPEYLMMLGAISQLSESEKSEIETIQAAIKELVKGKGDVGIIATVLVAMELQSAS
jgi:hypothetical protein